MKITLVNLNRNQKILKSICLYSHKKYIDTLKKLLREIIVSFFIISAKFFIINLMRNYQTTVFIVLR